MLNNPLKYLKKQFNYFVPKISRHRFNHVTKISRISQNFPRNPETDPGEEKVSPVCGYGSCWDQSLNLPDLGVSQNNEHQEDTNLTDAFNNLNTLYLINNFSVKWQVINNNERAQRKNSSPSPSLPVVVMKNTLLVKNNQFSHTKQMEHHALKITLYLVLA